MKKILLTFTAILMVAAANAQTDSSYNKKSPPDIDNINGGMNQNNNNDINNNQNRNRNNPDNQNGVNNQDPSIYNDNNQNQDQKNSGNRNGTINQNPHLNNNNNQNTQDNRDVNTNQNKIQKHADGYMMQNGKMTIIKNGKMTMMEKDITLSDGTVIMSNGNYMKKGSTTMMMQEGQHMDMMGNMTPAKTSAPKIAK